MSTAKKPDKSYTYESLRNLAKCRQHVIDVLRDEMAELEAEVARLTAELEATK
jgi:hypothetical protein